MSIKLGKTRDSRTRKQPKKAVNVAEAEQLKSELKNQKEFTEYLLLKGSAQAQPNDMYEMQKCLSSGQKKKMYQSKM